jgi:hypothetical protein
MSEFYASYIRFKCPNVNVWVYIDDFLITGEVKEEVNEALQLLKSKLHESGWLINEKKTSKEPVETLEFLGYILTAPGILSNSKERLEEMAKEFKQLWVKRSFF